MGARFNPMKIPYVVASANQDRMLVQGLVSLLTQREIPYQVITYRAKLDGQATTAKATAQAEFPIRKGHVFVTGLHLDYADGGANFSIKSLSTANRRITAGDVANDKLICAEQISADPAWPAPIRVNAGDTLNIGYADASAASAVGFVVIEAIHVPDRYLPKLRDIPTLEWFELGQSTLADSSTLDTNRTYSFDGPGQLFQYVYLGENSPSGSEGISYNLRINDEPLWGEPVTFDERGVLPWNPDILGGHIMRPVESGE